MVEFRLSKWYLDCVTAAGHASIAYTGVVEFGPVALHYSSLLESPGGTRHTLRAQPAPFVDESSVSWGGLGVRGEWARGTPDLRARIFQSDAGFVDWHCLVPSGPGQMGCHHGRGYAEHLTMTIAPWKIPIRTLRWGRFASAGEWIVWIDWLGEFERRLVYRNGGLAPVTVLDDSRIEFEDGARLVLDRSLVLREGPLGTSALAHIPRLRDTFPARLLSVHERKWLSRARFDAPGRAPVEEWAIHEVVEWPR